MFSVIIPTCGRPEMLAKCLLALHPLQQSIASFRYEVIVSDDAPSEKMRLWMAENYPWVTIIDGPQKGPAANRNNGARNAVGQWLVFTDDDCVPDQHWLSNFWDFIMKYPAQKVLEGAILPDNWSLLKKDMAECPVNDKGGCFWSANIAINKALFFELGGFDERFKIAAQEDQDLFLRLQPITTIPFVSGAQVIHPVRFDSLKNKYRKLGSRYANWILFYRKHHRQSLRLKLWKSTWIYIKSGVKELLRGKPKSLVNHWMNSMYCIYLLTIKGTR